MFVQLIPSRRSFVLAAFSLVCFAQAALAQAALVGYYKLNEDPTQTTSVLDHSGNNFTATRFGAVQNAAGTFGDAGGAFKFNPVISPVANRQFVRLPNQIAALDNLQANNYTLAAWVRPDSVPPATDNNNDSWSILVKNGFHLGLAYQAPSAGATTGLFRMTHWLTGDQNVAAATPDAFLPGEWYHVAGVVDRTAGQVAIFVNGILEETVSFTPNTAARSYGTEHWRIGSARGEINNNTFVRPMDGLIDDVLLFDQALGIELLGPIAFLGANAGTDYDGVSTLIDFHANGEIGDVLSLGGFDYQIADINSLSGFDGLGVGQGFVDAEGFLFLNLGGGTGLTTFIPIIPEPGTAALLLLGLAVAGGRRRNRARKA